MAHNFFKSGKKCVAIGRNYAKHAKGPLALGHLRACCKGGSAERRSCTAAEMGNALPKEPFFFLKPTTSYLANGGTVELPKGIDVHYEGWFIARLPYTASVAIYALG